MLPADQIKEGMYLDLEGDEFAELIAEDASDQHRADSESVIASFQKEYQFVEAVERETVTCVRIDCANVSFGCPPKHMLKVVDIG